MTEQWDEEKIDLLEKDLKQVQRLDRIIHEPARLAILAALNSVKEADFKFLCAVTGLTKGNLSRQSSQLEEAGYIQIRKYYRGRIPATSYQMTEKGRAAFIEYWQQMGHLQKASFDTQSSSGKESIHGRAR